MQFKFFDNTLYIFCTHSYITSRYMGWCSRNWTSECFLFDDRIVKPSVEVVCKFLYNFTVFLLTIQFKRTSSLRVLKLSNLFPEFLWVRFLESINLEVNIIYFFVLTLLNRLTALPKFFLARRKHQCSTHTSTSVWSVIRARYFSESFLIDFDLKQRES